MNIRIPQSRRSTAFLFRGVPIPRTIEYGASPFRETQRIVYEF